MTRDGTPLGMTADYEVSGQAGVRMQGHVVRFDAANGSFYDNGTYRVTVTGAKAIEFYYRPAVDLECSLAVTGDLYAGDKQEAQIYFCHPVTRQKITSDLLSGAQMYLTIKNNGKTVKDREPAGPDGKVSEVTLEEGTAELSAQAELPGGVTLNKPATAYTVKKKKTVAGFDQQSGVGANMWTIRQIDLKDNTAVKFTAQVVDENQNLVEEEEWQALTCNGETAHGVKLDVTKTGLSCPEVYVIPSADGKLSDVETGIQDFTVNVISSTGNVTKNTVTINIIPFDPIELKDESATFNQISLGRNNTSEFVTVRAVDPDTKNPLSDGIAALTELSLVSDGGQGLDWLIEKTGNSGEWKLTPRAIGLKADITTGRRTVRLRAVYDDGYDFTGAKALISEADLIVDIIATPPRYLTVDSRVPQDAYIRTRWKLIGSDKIRVTAKYEGQDLPKTVWDAAVDDSLTLTAVGNGVGKKIDFRIRKGADWGTWEIEVLPFAGKGYRTSYGKFEFKARVEIYDPVDEVGYTGEGTFTFEVEPDWWGVIQEFWYDYWPEILAAIYLLGLLFKKKFYFFGALIRVRRIKVAFTGVDQIGQAEANANPPVKNLQMSALQMLTFILPFISQRVDVNCSDGITNSYYGSFTAVATTTSMTRRNRAKFRIKGSLNLQNISNIDNQPANKETLKNGRFTLDNFSVMGKSGFGNVKTFSSR